MPKTINKNNAYRMLVDKFEAQQILRVKDVALILGKDRTTLYRWVKRKWIVSPIYINGQNKGWKKVTFMKWFDQL